MWIMSPCIQRAWARLRSRSDLRTRWAPSRRRRLILGFRNHFDQATGKIYAGDANPEDGNAICFYQNAGVGARNRAFADCSTAPGSHPVTPKGLKGLSRSDWDEGAGTGHRGLCDPPCPPGIPPATRP